MSYPRCARLYGRDEGECEYECEGDFSFAWDCSLTPSQLCRGPCSDLGTRCAFGILVRRG